MTDLSRPNCRTAGPDALFMTITTANHCSHVWAVPLQMLLNSIKARVTHVEAMTARGSQCDPFTIYKSALLFTLWGGGCLGKNLVWVSDEQVALLSTKEISLEMSNETIFLWKVSTNSPPTRQQKNRFCNFFVGCDRLRRNGSPCIQKRNAF